jgi:hypothetical protein
LIVPNIDEYLSWAEETQRNDFRILKVFKSDAMFIVIPATLVWPRSKISRANSSARFVNFSFGRQIHGKKKLTNEESCEVD